MLPMASVKVAAEQSALSYPTYTCPRRNAMANPNHAPGTTGNPAITGEVQPLDPE